MSEQTADAVEQRLRDDLARGDAMLASARPILRHLLANDDRGGLFSDETIARVRGMLLDVAGQLLFAHAAAAEAIDRPVYVTQRQDALAQALCEDTAFLAHAHALTIEGQAAELLHARSGVDAVVPQLIQELAASPEEPVAALAMSVLAAQARFLQHFRRMELPLGELPGELFHQALVLSRAHGDGAGGSTDMAERQLREGYDEGAGRLSLLTRLVMSMEQPATGALDLEHAGVAIFATALAIASDQKRDVTVLSFADRQPTRLALALRAAGLAPQAVEQQLLYLHPEAALPHGFDAVQADRAAALLAASRPQAVF